MGSFISTTSSIRSSEATSEAPEITANIPTPPQTPEPKMTTSVFSGFSYFENKIDNMCFVSAYPPGPNRCVYTGDLPVTNTYLFKDLFSQYSPEELSTQLYDFLASLSAETFGFADFFFLLKDFPSQLYSESIIRWYSSLYFSDSVMVDGVCRATVRSDDDDSFTKTVYIKDTTLPQEALDTFVFFASNNKIFTALGNKVKSPSLTINFTGQEKKLDVLKVGMHGTVILGEHLEAYEKKDMNTAYEEFLKNKETTGQEFLKIKGRAVKPAMRNLAEEFGFKSDDFQFDTYLVGMDTLDGRDPRYWTFGNNNQYGYQRPSQSLMIALVAHCDAPDTIPEPEDTHECTKGVIVSTEYALQEFSTSGKLKCAFPSHPRQFADCIKLLPFLV